jgi:hypothetical protein
MLRALSCIAAAFIPGIFWGKFIQMFQLSPTPFLNGKRKEDWQCCFSPSKKDEFLAVMREV